MKKRLIIALVLIMVLIPTGVVLAKKPLTLTTDYYFVFDPTAEPDPEGRSLAWAGTVSGDFIGTIEWWMNLGEMKMTGMIEMNPD